MFWIVSLYNIVYYLKYDAIGNWNSLMYSYVIVIIIMSCDNFLYFFNHGG